MRYSHGNFRNCRATVPKSRNIPASKRQRIFFLSAKAWLFVPSETMTGELDNPLLRGDVPWLMRARPEVQLLARVGN
jgi:hypothetical protein